MSQCYDVIVIGGGPGGSTAAGSLARSGRRVLLLEMDGGWALSWRLRLFSWIVRLRARWPLVPRLDVS
jgi:choline dehydrogenase-like flavoprotein